MLTRKSLVWTNILVSATIPVRSIVTKNENKQAGTNDLDLILSEIDKVNINTANLNASRHKSKKTDTQSVHESKSNNSKSEVKHEKQEKPEINGKKVHVNKVVASATYTKEIKEQSNASRVEQIRLIRQLRRRSNIKEKLRVMREEEKHLAKQSVLEEVVPSSPAKTFMSTSELIQAGSPQHLESYSNSSESVKQFPCLRQSGCVAMVSLVGTVSSIHDCANEEIKSQQSESIEESNEHEVSVYTDLLVEYNAPIVTSVYTKQTIKVRCCGATLSEFASRNVQPGDLIHVLGHLSTNKPKIDESETQTTSATMSTMIVVLPAGGNISIVLARNSLQKP